MTFKYQALMIFSVLLVMGMSVAVAQSPDISITVSSDKNSDTIIVTGKTVSTITDVTFRVTSPNGDNVVAISAISPDVEGNFVTEFKVGPTWSENGFYTITAMQSIQQNSLYTLNVKVEVINGMVANHTSVIETNLENSLFDSIITDEGIIMQSKILKSNLIEITGTTDRLSTDITLTVVAPNGNIVSIDQVSPGLNGEFIHIIEIINNSLWKQDGTYTITAKQFDSSIYSVSSEIEIKDNFATRILYKKQPQSCVGCSLEDSRKIAIPHSEKNTILILEGSSEPGCEKINQCFMPSQLEIKIGDTITWINDDSAFNTITSITENGEENGLFDSGFIEAGNFYSREFLNAGNFYYHSSLHPWMKGIITVQQAFGQLTNDSIVVTTDKASYSEGETIVITGEVRDLYSGTLVSVIVKAPDGNLVSMAQVYPDTSKKFRNEVTAGGALMEKSGIYTITIQYGTVNRSATTAFEFEDSTSYSSYDYKNKFTVDSNRHSYTSGDIIKIIGSISPLTDYSQKVTILVVSPDENIVTIVQVIPSLDGSFSTTFKAGGTMTISGDYEIRAQYGVQKVFDTFVFTENVSTKPPTHSPCGAGTHYDARTNSCKLDYIHPNDNKENKLQKENTQLKLENKQLKNQINTLQEKLDNLQSIINEQIKVIMDTFQELKDKL